MTATFSIVPIEVWRDRRLTLEQIRVLGVLFSFRGKSTDVVWPSRSQIAERSGMHISNISSATTALMRLGWLQKDGKGGHSKATRYTITVPDLGIQDAVADSATVAREATVADSATPPLADSATPPLADSATRKELTSELTNEQTTDMVVTLAFSGPAADSCPVAEIVSIYHQLLPDNPRCKVLSEARRGAIRARWKQAAKLNCKPFGYRTRNEGLAAWELFFKICAESDFLTGKAPAQPGKPPFVADIDFLMSPSGFAKTIENKYHREPAELRRDGQNALFRGAI